MKRTITLTTFLFVCMILASSLATGAPQSMEQKIIAPHRTTTLKPKTEVRAPTPLPIVCARLSHEIQQDKNQLRSVLGYLADNDCYNQNVTPSATCTNLFNKKNALETRIEANQEQARRDHCF